MITLDLDKTIEQEINDIAKTTGKNNGQVVTDIILAYLEDTHDALLAEKAIDELRNGEETTLTLAELEQSINALDS
jgi:predicted DNA-binding protein